jgi:hypothetical protein
MSLSSDVSAGPPHATFEDAMAVATGLNDELGRVIIGQPQVRREVLICLLAGGHCLLRGVPGLATRDTAGRSNLDCSKRLRADTLP